MEYTEEQKSVDNEVFNNKVINVDNNYVAFNSETFGNEMDQNREFFPFLTFDSISPEILNYDVDKTVFCDEERFYFNPEFENKDIDWDSEQDFHPFDCKNTPEMISTPLNSLSSEYSLMKRHVCSFPECKKSFRSVSELSRHSFRHKGEKPYKCDRCEKAFVRYDDLKRHFYIHTGEKPFKCDDCDFKCIQSYDLVKHRFTHTQQKPFKCEICGKTFNRSARLREHARLHTGEKPFACIVCERSFTQQSSLTKHSKVHSSHKFYYCFNCNNVFESNSELKIHLMTQPECNIFRCQVCLKDFSSLKNFKRHVKIHSERQYVCEICHYSCVTMEEFFEHSKSHDPNKIFQCHLCGRGFTEHFRLKVHLSKAHSEPVNYKCSVCGREFHHRNHLTLHMRIHLSLPFFKCELCQNSFHTKNLLVTHCQKFHKNSTIQDIESSLIQSQTVSDLVELSDPPLPQYCESERVSDEDSNVGALKSHHPANPLSCLKFSSPSEQEDFAFQTGYLNPNVDSETISPISPGFLCSFHLPDQEYDSQFDIPELGNLDLVYDREY